MLRHRDPRLNLNTRARLVWESLVKLVKILLDDKAVMPDEPTFPDRERIAFFNKKNCGNSQSDSCLRRYWPAWVILLERKLNYMRASVRGRNELAARVQQTLLLPTKKQAEQIVDVVIGSLESTLLNNLGTNGFTLKLGTFGKFSVRHKPGILRKIPFTGKMVLTKDRRKIRFVSLGELRQLRKSELK